MVSRIIYVSGEKERETGGITYFYKVPACRSVPFIGKDTELKCYTHSWALKTSVGKLQYDYKLIV